MEVTPLELDKIVVRDRLRREIDRETVDRLKESISTLGLGAPLLVHYLSDEDVYLLVAGWHRLQACIELGMERVPVHEVDGDDIDLRLWEIAENLYRAELDYVQRSEHVAEWNRLNQEKDRIRISAQPAPKTAKDGSTRGRPEGGINAAARQLGLERTEVQRAIKIDGLKPEAKAEARELRLADNQTALLKAEKEDQPEQQVQVLRDHAAKRAVGAKRKPETSANRLVRDTAIVNFSRILHQHPADTLDGLMRLLGDEQARIFEIPLQKRVVLARAYLQALGVTLADLSPQEGVK